MLLFGFLGGQTFECGLHAIQKASQLERCPKYRALLKAGSSGRDFSREGDWRPQFGSAEYQSVPFCKATACHTFLLCGHPCRAGLRLGLHVSDLPDEGANSVTGEVRIRKDRACNHENCER
jgi:hypothetical protein